MANISTPSNPVGAVFRRELHKYIVSRSGSSESHAPHFLQMDRNTSARSSATGWRRTSLALALAGLLPAAVAQAQAYTASDVEEYARLRGIPVEQAVDEIALNTGAVQPALRSVSRKSDEALDTLVDETTPLSSAVRKAETVDLQRATSLLSSSGMQGLFQRVLGLVNLHWANQHVNMLRPTTGISRGGAQPSPLEAAPMDLNSVRFAGANGSETSLAQWQKDTATDGLLVLHRGQVVYENYDHGMSASSRHAWWSVTKSLTGLLARDMIEAGQLDAQAPVKQYLPELEGSAWGDSTVQQTLDMTTAANYGDSISRSPGIIQYLFASNIVPASLLYPGPRTMVDFLKTIQKDGEHGARFSYKTTETEVVGLVLEKITGKDFATLTSERIWGPMGAEHDAYVLRDSQGTQLKGSGVSSSLRDLARLGELVRLEGRFNGKQLLQPGTVAAIRKGDPGPFHAGEPNARAGVSYHDFWWLDAHKDGTMEARGLAGQNLYIDPAAELVVARFSTKADLNPSPGEGAAFNAIAEAVRQR